MQPDRLSRTIGHAFLAIAAVLFFTYAIYLPFPEAFQGGTVQDTGLILYGLATASGAFAAWGWILRSLAGDKVDRRAVMSGSALGFLMLGIMRLETAVFPPPPLDQVLFVPIGEGIAFVVVAWLFFNKR